MSGSSSPMPEQVVTTHVVGIDIGMESCTMSCLTMDKRQVIKATPFANTLEGFDWLFERLKGLGVTPKELLVGLEATSRDAGESVAGPAQAWLPGLPVTSGPDACRSFATRVTSENGSARRHDDRASAAQRRSALRLRTKSSRWRPTAN
jgi:hypothetical protein